MVHPLPTCIAQTFENKQNEACWSETWGPHRVMIDDLGNLGRTLWAASSEREARFEVDRWGRQGARVGGVE